MARFRLRARQWISVGSNIQHRADNPARDAVCLVTGNLRQLFFVHKVYKEPITKICERINNPGVAEIAEIAVFLARKIFPDCLLNNRSSRKYI